MHLSSVAYAIVRHVNAVPVWMRSLPMPARWVVIGASIAGVAGAIVGLVVGLFVHAPTAPFAAVEVGFPAMLTGGIVGLVARLIMITIRRIRQCLSLLLLRRSLAGQLRRNHCVEQGASDPPFAAQCYSAFVE